VRIIYVTASLPYGPSEAFIIPEVNELIRRGHSVTVIPRSPRSFGIHAKELAAEVQAEGLLTHRVLQRAAGYLLAHPVRVAALTRYVFQSRSLSIAIKNFSVLPKALWLANFAQHWGADHIHCHWAATTATMAMIASDVSDIPWSFTAHRWDIVENNLLSLKARKASFVRFISTDGFRMAADLGVKQEGKVKVLRMGVKMLQQTAERPARTNIVLCPANLVEVKGHKFLLEAWRILLNHGIDAELWLAGEGELRPGIEKLIKRLGLTQKVKLLGAVAHHRLLQFYKNRTISAVVLASIDMGKGCHEGIPVALMEAMGHGVPVVATDTGAISELVLPGTGLLVPSQNPAALAEAVQSLLEDNALANELACSGRARVQELYDVERTAAMLERWFLPTFARIPEASWSTDEIFEHNYP
jgi:glycosyltransferase involved in cell wall biosynthesis